MPFITKATQKDICQHIDLKKIGNYPTDDLYKLNLGIFSERERVWLAAAKMLFESPEMFINYAYRKKEKPTDSGKTVYAERQKAYHEDRNCEFLKSDYENFSIPTAISEEPGQPRVKEFREWFVENIDLFNKDEDAFLFRMTYKFGLQKSPPIIQSLRSDNSGVIDFENLDLGMIESKIDEVIVEMEDLRSMRNEYGDAIRRFGDSAHIKNADEKVNNYLKKWKSQKSVLKDMLLIYFRVKFNRDLEFEGGLLEQVGLKKCAACTTYVFDIGFVD